MIEANFQGRNFRNRRYGFVSINDYNYSPIWFVLVHQETFQDCKGISNNKLLVEGYVSETNVNIHTSCPWRQCFVYNISLQRWIKSRFLVLFVKEQNASSDFLSLISPNLIQSWKLYEPLQASVFRISIK